MPLYKTSHPHIQIENNKANTTTQTVVRRDHSGASLIEMIDSRVLLYRIPLSP